MAMEDWCNWDPTAWDDEWDDREPVPFQCLCKWCGKEITMTPTEGDRWLPVLRGELHVCEERKVAQAKDALMSMPDLSLPECQFCSTPMEYQRFESDPEDGPGWGFPSFSLCCRKCGSTGPTIAFGHPEYDHLLKTIK